MPRGIVRVTFEALRTRLAGDLPADAVLRAVWVNGINHTVSVEVDSHTYDPIPDGYDAVVVASLT